MAPSTQVFSTVELLESILDHVTPKDLLLWQRLNSTFRDIIKRSNFRRKLFFEADTFVTADGEVGHQFPNWNTFLDDFWKKHFGINSDMAREGIDERDSLYMDHPSGSWKDMFLTSPALKHIEVDVLDAEAKDFHSIRIVSEHGITIGQLMKEAVQFPPMRQWHSLRIRPPGSRKGFVSV